MSSFVDRAQLHAKAGDGGAGAISFRREAHVDRGGPDGGSGGHGGDIWVVASTNQASLIGFRDHPHRRAADGGHGASKRKTGATGADLEVPLPVGTVIKDRDGEVLCDLPEIGDRWLVAHGGRGGRGNATFLSNRRRAPAFGEQGERGEERWLTLELKLVADVAIVGFPNVGKSTLISSVSAAKPKIADYPFTTLEPHLGVVTVPDGSSNRSAAGAATDFVIADVPGLVEGAAEGKGLGHEFLRHVERARVLLILVDLAATGGVDAATQLEVLLAELGRYQSDLLERPRIVVGSKADLVADRAAGGEVDTEIEISAATGEGVGALIGRLAELVSAARVEVEPSRPAIVIHRPLGEQVTAERLGPGIFEIVGRAAERAVALSDLNDDQALDVVLGRLRRLGVDRVLARGGARDGDEVRVGELSFTWYRYGPDNSLDPVVAEPASRRRTRKDDR
jgi:GTP-binding protein